MKKGFRQRIADCAYFHKSRIVLADDVSLPKTAKAQDTTLQRKAMSYIRILSGSCCAVKLNLHLMLPLKLEQLKKITTLAHSFDMQTIADLKLNDIGDTNTSVLNLLKRAGFDSVIANPIMGPENLSQFTSKAHSLDQGVIALVHMSHPDAKKSYGLDLASKKDTKRRSYSRYQNKKKLHDLFLQWSLEAKVDGIVVGATVPNLICDFKKRIRDSCDIYSPGVGKQGGDIQRALKAGMDYAIVGRSLVESKNPRSEAQKLQSFFAV